MDFRGWIPPEIKLLFALILICGFGAGWLFLDLLSKYVSIGWK